MSVYVGVVESEIEYGQCRDSIENITLRKDDIKPVFIRATKGYEARQMHFNNWLNETTCEAMLLLDGDMIFPRDTLEKLRNRNMPYLSGAYMRRTYKPLAPVWFEDGDSFPYRPYTAQFKEGELIKIGASGWGCIFITREVAEAVRVVMKGEQFVLEDDLDVYPYDLKRVMMAIDMLDTLSSKDIPANALRDYVNVLKDEIRPLRGVKDIVGSDIRFPFFAKLAGYDLYLDTSVLCGHMLNYNLTPQDYATQKADDEIMTVDWKKERARLDKALNDLRIANVVKANRPENVTPQGTGEREKVNALTVEQGGAA